jgi:response regulator RpfG family c-di-GMP phosphodiesterase
VHLARHHKTGENPFVVVIATTDDPSPANVRRILDSGVDDIILKPLRIRPLLERIERQITERKHFVVTHRYIGPDRRDGTRKDEAHPIPSIPVPNTLRATVVNQTNRIRLRELINAVWHQVNEHKMERHSAQIAWLVERLLPTLRQDIIDNVVKERLALLQETAMELSLRVKSSRFDHVSGLAVSLIEVARSLRDCPPPPDRRTIDLLPNLSNAITTAFGSFDKTVKTSHEISHAVQQHTWPQGKTNLHN